MVSLGGWDLGMLFSIGRGCPCCGETEWLAHSIWKSQYAQLYLGDMASLGGQYLGIPLSIVLTKGESLFRATHYIM